MAASEPTATEKATLLRLARDTIERRVRGREAPDPSGYELTERLRQDSGAFVTLHARGQLRGCIGYIEPIAPLWRAVLDNAESAALRDWRFGPVQPAELASITLEISVLTPPEPVDSWRAIEIGRHGMTLARGGRRSVFLPQVAPEQGWGLEETLTHLALKAGLPAGAWREGASFTVFEAFVFGEHHGTEPR